MIETPALEEGLPNRLPEALSSAIEEVLSQVAFADAGGARCTLLSVSECELSAEANASAARGDLSIPIVFEPSLSYALATIGAPVAHRVIDRIFGPAELAQPTLISPIETAIVEFLAAKIVAAINDRAGSEHLSVGESITNPDAIFSEHEAGAAAWLQVEAEGFSQVFRILASKGFLSGLRKTIPDFAAEPRSAARLFRRVTSVPLRAQLGYTRVEAAALAYLETGDVVIVEESPLKWNDLSPQGNIRLFAGASDNFVLTGGLTTNGSAPPGPIRVFVNDVSSKEPDKVSRAGRFIMNERTPDESGPETRAVQNGGEFEPPENDEVSPSLENLQLRLRVELVGKNITIREINDLRAGQVIDLERAPTDSVNLVTDGSDDPVAVGELVDIEGRLGVRITKVLI